MLPNCPGPPCQQIAGNTLVWKPQYVFPLLPVALDKTDILEAMLRDALEEIEHLKRTRPEPVYL
ncbi:hypothetical protein EON65_54440, partial [archaeon]